MEAVVEIKNCFPANVNNGRVNWLHRRVHLKVLMKKAEQGKTGM